MPARASVPQPHASWTTFQSDDIESGKLMRMVITIRDPHPTSVESRDQPTHLRFDYAHREAWKGGTSMWKAGIAATGVQWFTELPRGKEGPS